MSQRDKRRAIGALVPFVGDASVRLEGVELAWTLPVVALSHEAILVRSPESAPSGSLVHLELTTGAELVQGMGEVAGARAIGEGHEILIQLLFVDEQSRTALRRLVSESRGDGTTVEWSAGAGAPAEEGAQAEAEEAPRGQTPPPTAEAEPSSKEAAADAAARVERAAPLRSDEASSAESREPDEASTAPASPSGWTLDPIDPTEVEAVDLGNPGMPSGWETRETTVGENPARVFRAAVPPAADVPPGQDPAGERAGSRFATGNASSEPGAAESPAGESAGAAAAQERAAHAASHEIVAGEEAGAVQGDPRSGMEETREGDGQPPKAADGLGDRSRNAPGGGTPAGAGPARAREADPARAVEGPWRTDPAGAREVDPFHGAGDGWSGPLDEIPDESGGTNEPSSRSRTWALPALLLIVAFLAAAWWTRDSWLGRPERPSPPPERGPAAANQPRDTPPETSPSLAAGSERGRVPPAGEVAEATGVSPAEGEEAGSASPSPPSLAGDAAAERIAPAEGGDPLGLLGVDVKPLPGETRVTVSLSGPIRESSVSSFGLATPPRFVVKLGGVAGAGLFPGGTPELARIRAGIHEGPNDAPETHLVFDLAALATTGSFSVSGSTIEVRLVTGG